MPRPKSPSQYPKEYLEAVQSARKGVDVLIPCPTPGFALNLRRHMYMWAKACRDNPEQAPGLSSLIDDVEFSVVSGDLMVRAKSRSPYALAIRRALPLNPATHPGLAPATNLIEEPTNAPVDSDELAASFANLLRSTGAED